MGLFVGGDVSYPLAADPVPAVRPGPGRAGRRGVSGLARLAWWGPISGDVVAVVWARVARGCWSGRWSAGHVAGDGGGFGPVTVVVGPVQALTVAVGRAVAAGRAAGEALSGRVSAGRDGGVLIDPTRGPTRAVSPGPQVPP
jgi:hypothetical protein